MKPTKIKAVLISDVHFSLSTLNLASASLKAALEEAGNRNVPLIVAGDLMDTKAIIRAECANVVIELMASYPDVRKIVLVGNHDLINEKSQGDSLHFLDAYCDVVRVPTFDYNLNVWLVPYQSNTEALANFITKATGTLVMHQGLHGAYMGEYVVDKTSLPPEMFDGLRVISGHYHRAQEIKCGKTGLWNYIGTPYSITFAEAHDGPKGIQLLHSDGVLTRIPLNLRKHVAVERTFDAVLDPIPDLNPEDLLWIKVSGPASELDKLNKKEIGLTHLGHENFKLDKVYAEAAKLDLLAIEALPDDQVLDKLIEDSEETLERKELLRKVWREIL